MTRAPHAVNHVGINVPDLGAAVAWYVSVLGFEVVHPARRRSSWTAVPAATCSTPGT